MTSRRLVILLVVTALFRSSQNMALTTLSLLGHGDLHLSSGTIGVLGALAGLTLAGTTIFIAGRVPGRLAERSAGVGLALVAAAIGIFAVAASLGAMVLATLLIGVGGGLAVPGLLNAVEHGDHANSERVIGLYTITLSVSLAAGPLLETLILAATGEDLRAPFIAFCALPLCGAAVLLWLSRSGSAGGLAEHRVPRRRGPLKALLASADGRRALIIQLLYAIPFAALTSFGALVGKEGFGVSASHTQLAFSGFFAASLAARVFVSWRSPIERKHPLLWGSASLTVTGLVALGTGHGLVALLLAMAVLGIPHGLTFPLVLGLVAGASSRADLPGANAALLGSTNLTAVAVPPILGMIIPIVGYHHMVLLLIVPVVLLAGLFALQRSTSSSAGTTAGRTVAAEG
ncbi:MAG TPA: MFS transporter [Solirubrobacteraceae bacterium]|nr:MFS transporter [Solirubrobacteraceae bacterium]